MDAPQNIEKPVLDVFHVDLERTGDSIFRSKCPVCNKGMLLVHRNQRTLKLEEYDHCISCGQRVKYLDIGILRKVFR
jgi:hypothetical protein